MPKILPSGADVLIKYLSTKKYSRSMIKRELSTVNMNVSLQSISNVINNVGTKRKLMSEGKEVPHFKRHRSVRTEENIKAVKKYVCRKNPKTHSFIQNKLKMSTSTINKIIHKDLDLETE